jgi:hypothetical protein
VAIHTPAHRETRELIDLRHCLNRSVTFVALLAGFDVRRVIELHEIRQHVDLFPSDRLAGVVGGLQFLNPRTVGFDLNVTVHTDVQTWDRSVTRNFNARVTVLTIDLHLARVQFVRERKRLIRLIILIVADHDLIVREHVHKEAQSTHETKNNHSTDELFYHYEPSRLLIHGPIRVRGLDPHYVFSLSPIINRKLKNLSLRFLLQSPITHC